MRKHGLSWLALTSVATGLGLAGCRAPDRQLASAPPRGTLPPASWPTTTQATGQGFDPAKALLSLDEVPPVVRMPKPAEKPDRTIPSQAVKHYLAARDLYHQWRNAECIEEIEQALRYDPGSPECHLLLGRAALRAGNEGQSLNHLREAAKLRPDDTDCQYMLGVLAVKNNKAEEAVCRFRLALISGSADPDRAETVLTHLRLGEVLFNTGYLSAAIDQLDKFEQAVVDPRGKLWRNRELLTILRTKRAVPSLMIGRAAMLLRRYAQAVDAFARALRIEPGNLRTKVRYAQTLSRAGRRGEAFDLARELALREKKSESKAGVELLGWIHKDAGKSEGITGELRRLLAAHPDRDEFSMLLADSLMKFGGKDQAKDVLEKLISRRPKLVAAYLRLAALLEQQGRIRKAVHILADAIAAGPETHTGVLRAVSRLGGSTKTVRRVVEQADRILAEDDKNASLGYVVGLIAYRGDRQVLAVRCFNRTLGLNKTFLPAYLSLGRLHLDRYEWSKAIGLADRANKAGQDSSAITYLQARAYDGLDDIKRATASYEKVIERDAKSVTAMISLGGLYERIGNQNKARQEYQRALKIVPGNDVAGERYVRLLLTKGEISEAKKALQLFRRSGGSRNAIGRCLAVMASRGKMSQYRRLIGKLLERSPKDAMTRYDLASSYHGTREYGKARVEVDRILKIAPGDHKARFLMAELCRKSLNYQGAADVLAGMLTEHPNRHAWLLSLAEVRLDMQDYDRAEAIIAKLLSRASSKGRRSAYRLRLLGIHISARANDKALATASAWLDEAPKSLTARRLMIETLHEAGQDERAVKLAEQWVAEGDKKRAKEKTKPAKKDASVREGRSLLITAYASAEQYDQAFEVLLGWMEEDPSSRTMLRQLWASLVSAKRYDDAAELCRSVIPVLRSPAAYRLMLAQSYLEADRYDEALDSLEKMPESERNELTTRLEIMILIEAKRFDRAVRVTKQAVARARDDQIRVAMRRVLVLVHQRQGRMDLATEVLKKIYAERPKEPGTNNDLGYTWADEGKNLDKAERMIRYALGEEPRNSAYMDSLGWVLYKKGDFREAVRWLEKARRAQRGDDPVIFEHLGDAHWRLGEKGRAKKNWQRSVELSVKERQEGQDPADPEALARVRKRLAQVKGGQEPSLPSVSSQPSTSAATEPVSKPASADR